MAKEAVKSTHDCVITLASPAPDDALYAKKQALLAKRALRLTFHSLSMEMDGSGRKTYQCLQSMLHAARILQLTETELYFVEDGDCGPFSIRNEMQALLSLHATVCDCINARAVDDSFVLLGLRDTIVAHLNSFEDEQASKSSGTPCTSSKDATFFAWAAAQGIKSRVTIAVFEETGRGVAAEMDVQAGELVLDVPEEAIISEDSAMFSDMGATFQKVAGLSGETKSLLWSMRTRQDLMSKFAPYFASLPDSIGTGLSFGMGGLKALEGSLVLEELLYAQEHLRSQYNSLFPSLSRQYPEVFPEEFFTWEHFLWAAEFWYSNGIKVVFPDGTTKTCLIPMLGLFNHSVYPHVTHYSTINASSNSLQLFTVRRCKAGEQCFLSYGALPNSHLLTFYGFVLQANPYDIIPIGNKHDILGAPWMGLHADLDMEQISCQAQHMLVERYEIQSSHMLQAGMHALPSRLLGALRVLCMDQEEATLFSGDPKQTVVSAENEEAAVNVLLSTVEALLHSLGASDEPPRREALAEASSTDAWDVQLAWHFTCSQRKLLQTVHSLCLKSMSEIGDED